MLVSKKKLVTIFLAILLSEKCFSQEGYTPYNYVSNPQCSNCRVGPSNPSAPSAYLSEYENNITKPNLGNFGNTGVNNYTGVPAISIPLYEIKTRDFSLPILLSYDASGIKVNQEASECGLGWNIEGLPSISRVVRGGDDFKSSSNGTDNIAKYMDDLTTSANCNLKNSCVSVNDGSSLHNKINNEADLQSDIFSLNVGGRSYQFILDHSRVTNRQVYLLSIEKISITLVYSNNCQIPGFEVIMPNGVKYYFGAPPGTYSQKIYMPSSPNIEYVHLWKQEQGTPNVETEEYFATKWLGRRIETPSSDVIEIIYGSSTGCFSSQTTDNKNYIYNTIQDLQDGIPNKIGSEKNIVYSAYGSLPNMINFPMGTLTFNDEGGRIDLDMGGFRLTSLEVARNEVNYIGGQVVPGKLIKKYIFEYDFFNSELTQTSTVWASIYKRLKLLKIKEVDVITGNTLPPYEFTYNESTTVGTVQNLPIKLPPKNSCSFDHWGYFNNKNPTSTIVLPTKENVDVQGITVSFDGLDRNSDINYAQIGVLTKIIYPSGGFTEYTYESNDYNSPLDPKRKVGGLRIKKIRTSDGDANTSNDIYRVYSYILTDAQGNITTNSSGVLMDDIMYTRVPVYGQDESAKKGWPVVRSSQNILPSGTHAFGNIVGYSEVHVMEGLNGELGKTVYKYHALPNYHFENFSGNLPAKNYYNYVYNNIEKITMGAFSNLMYVRNGLPKEINSFKKVGTDFKIIGKVENSYNNTNANSTMSFSSKPNIYKSSKYFLTATQVPNGAGYCTVPFYNCNRVELLIYRTPVLRLKLTSVKKTTYDPSDITKFMSEITTYEYDNTTHFQLKRVCENIGEKGSVCVEFSYPMDYYRMTPTNNALIDMKSDSRYIHSAVVEKVIKKDIQGDGVYKVIGSSYTDYRWATTNTSPIVISKTWNLETDIPLTETTNYSLSSSPGYFIKAETLWQNYDLISMDNNYPSTATETFVTYDDKGNCLSKTNESNVFGSYIYGYSQNLPIVKVNNADKSQFAYTGFEGGAPSTDLWSLGSSTLMEAYTGSTANTTYEENRPYVYSGRYAVKIPKSIGSPVIGPNKEITPAQQTGKYKLSCYIKTDALSNNMASLVIHTKVAGDNTNSIYPNISQACITTPISNTNAKWQYFEAIIDLDYIRQSQNISPSTILSLRCYSVNQDINNPIYIDEIRVHPIDAEMVTYTHQLLVGPDSETDINNYTKFIEYDGFNRIRLVKDNDGNILKRYKYEYK